MLAYVGRQDLADRWNYEVSYTDAPNGALSMTLVSVYVCPEDGSVKGAGDLSCAVNGGIGYSTFLNDVNVAFADGSAKFISRDISGRVYASLFSPASQPLNDLPLRQVVPSENEY